MIPSNSAVVAISSIVGGLVVIYLALSGRLEEIFRFLTRRRLDGQKGPKPMRLEDFSNQPSDKATEEYETGK